MRLRLAPVVCFVVQLMFSCASGAQEYPTRTIRLISPFPPGGYNDILSRIVGQKLGEAWKQQIVVENRAGANMIIGTELVAKSPPDGYTMVMTSATHAINPSLYKLPYDSIKDFTPIILVASNPLIFAVHPSVQAQTVKDFIALARSRSEQFNFASFGSGSASHLAGELFNRVAGIKMVHIPYKGANPAITGILAGEVQVYIGSLASVYPHVRSGKLRAFGVTTLQRSGAAPDLPTIIEAGVPGFDVSSWFGILGPAGIPQTIVQKINSEVQRIIRLPEIKDRLLRDGADPLGGTAEQFAETIRADLVKWAQVVKDSGARVN